MFHTKPPISAFGRIAVALLVLYTSAHNALAQANQVGKWTTLSYGMDQINPIHLVLLHNGKVLIVAGSENVPDEHNVTKINKAAVWDTTNVETGSIRLLPNLAWDVFCNGMAVLPDGRPIVVGGTEQYDPFYGDPRTTIFDPDTEKFIQVHSMAHGRWYATVIALAAPTDVAPKNSPDNYQLLTFSGLNEMSSTNNAVEMYKVGVGWSQEYVAPWSPPLYPWLHLLPSGKIFCSGSNPSSHMFDPVAHTWTLNVAQTNYAADRQYGSSVLLPLLPLNYVPRVMILGGNPQGFQGTVPATDSTEIIDLSASAPPYQWVDSGKMSEARIQMDAVLLPDGKLLAEGGSLYNEDLNTASLNADLFDTAAFDPTNPQKAWSSAGTASYARLYHSVALLLPDARVVVAGGNPVRGTYEHAIEVYTPPYLFTTDASGAVVPASRPSITSAPSEIGYGQAFTVGVTPPPNAAIQSVVLMRPGSSTHAFDMEQRLVGLTFSASGSTLNVNAPPNSNIAPPGYYMLFVLISAPNEPTKQVPSVAAFVRLSSNPGNPAPKGAITQPTSDPLTVQAGTPVTFAGSGTDTSPGSVTTYSWCVPFGQDVGSLFTTPKSNLQNPGPVTVTFSTPGTYVASLTTVDNQDENDPSPPTRTITVTAAQAQLTVNITQPGEGSVVRGKNVSVGAKVTGATGSLNTFTLEIIPSSLGTVTSSQTKTVPGTNTTFKWDTTKVPNGLCMIRVSVRDLTGKTDTASKNVTVKN
jgi:hypothetical protein